MNELSGSRRRFLKAAGLSVGAALVHSRTVVAESSISTQTNDLPCPVICSMLWRSTEIRCPTRRAFQCYGWAPQSVSLPLLR